MYCRPFRQKSQTMLLPLSTRLSKSSLHCNTTSLTRLPFSSIDIATKYPNNTTQSRRSTHTFAITRQIPNSFRDALSAHHDASSQNDPISLTKCRNQHSRYQSVLQSLLPQPLLSLPPLEDHPDCPFVEDVVVVADGVACITNPGHASRRGREVDTVKTALLNDDRLEGHFVEGETLFDMRRDGDDPMATADGGDVLYTGRHFFVGLSDRTNERGWEVLRSVFGSRLRREDVDDDDDDEVVVAVPPVIRGKSVLHLKSAVTHLDPHTLLAPEGPIGDEVLTAMKAEERGYVAIRLKDVLTCNAVVVNGHVMVQDSGCEVSKERIVGACVERGLGWTFVDTGELAKKDAALTCCSVLLEC